MHEPRISHIVEGDQDIALELLAAMMEHMGNHATREVHADDLHRITCLMSAMVLDADSTVSTAQDAAQISSSLGLLIDRFAGHLKASRQDPKISLLDGLCVPKRRH